MKTYYIFDENRHDVNCLVKAKNEKSALKKYRNGLMSSGFCEIVSDQKFKYALISTFGMYVTAIECHYPEQMKNNRYLVTIE